MNRLRFTPRLEALEERAVPATLRLIGDSLYISNQSATTLTLTATGTNTFTVQDGTTTLANVRVGGTINITGRTLADEVKVLMNGNTFTGNFLFNMGNGNDTIDIRTNAAAEIRGSINLITGYGDDSIALNRNGTATLTFGGQIQLTDQLGNDTVDLGNATAPTLFLGDVSLLSANDVNVGFGQADRFGHDLTIQSLQDGRSVDVFFDKNAQVDRHVNITGSALADRVEFFGPNTVGGTLDVSLGSGSDSITIGNNAPLSVNGNFNLDMGEDDNFYDLDATFVVAGNMTIRAGEGNNLVNNINAGIGGNLRVFFGNGVNNINVATTGLAISGQFQYSAGNGFNAVGIADAVIGGDVLIQLGNGDNVVSINDPAIIGGTYHLRTGNGNNSFIVATIAAPVKLDVLFGSGNDTVSYFPGVVVTGYIDGGVGANTLNDFGATFLPPYTQANFA
jgi:hypothetical protein